MSPLCCFFPFFLIFLMCTAKSKGLTEHLTKSSTSFGQMTKGALLTKYDPEINMDALQIIQHWGYPGEQHAVTTKDGYILDIHRIPRGKSGAGNTTRPVIFLQHGLLCSSTNWITNLPNEAAGFIFADAGFDVWLGNFRGNTYALKHKTLSSKEHKFWEFSWDEMAEYDLEAMINYALDVSNQSQLYYMGHSEGTITAFAKFSSDLEFGSKIKKFFALGPVVTARHIKGAFKIIAPFTDSLQWILNMLGYDQFLPSSWLMNELAKYLCGSEIGNPLCDNILFLIAGPNSKQLNEMVRSGKFQKYDYGNWVKNIQHYGQATPPLYDVGKMKVPVALFWDDIDWLADPQDIRESLIPYLQNLFGNYEYRDFNHLDFIWGLRAAPEVYNKIVNIVKKSEF